jgi:hypothetical protein
MEGDTGEVGCPRCGHDRKTAVGTTTKLMRAVRGKKSRVQCGAPTDLGWVCPCRSRFHAA